MLTIATLAPDYAAISLRTDRYRANPWNGANSKPGFPGYSYDYPKQPGYEAAREILHGTRAVPDSMKLTIQRDRQFVGATLSQYSNVERIMSDVWDSVGYVDCWNEAEQRVETICIGCGDLSQQIVEVEVDATPEIVAKAAAWKAEQKRQADERARAYKAEQEARTFRSGKRCKVVRGRKVPLGTEGVIFWMGHDNYGKRKLGIATTERKENGRYADVVWTAESNCELLPQGGDGI